MKLSYNERVALMACSVPASHRIPNFYRETMEALNTEQLLRHVALTRLLETLEGFAYRLSYRV